MKEIHIWSAGPGIGCLQSCLIKGLRLAKNVVRFPESGTKTYWIIHCVGNPIIHVHLSQSEFVTHLRRCLF